jgi:hypothetical protein
VGSRPSGNAKALALFKKVLAVWRHPFRGDGPVIDLDAIVARLELGRRHFRGFGLTTPVTKALEKSRF